MDSSSIAWVLFIPGRLKPKMQHADNKGMFININAAQGENREEDEYYK
jgi:hypothetical protein